MKLLGLDYGEDLEELLLDEEQDHQAQHPERNVLGHHSVNGRDQLGCVNQNGNDGKFVILSGRDGGRSQLGVEEDEIEELGNLPVPSPECVPDPAHTIPETTSMV